MFAFSQSTISIIIGNKIKKIQAQTNYENRPIFKSTKKVYAITNTKKVQKAISKKNPYNQISLAKELGCSQHTIYTIIH